MALPLRCHARECMRHACACVFTSGRAGSSGRHPIASARVVAGRSGAALCAHSCAAAPAARRIGNARAARAQRRARRALLRLLFRHETAAITRAGHRLTAIPPAARHAHRLRRTPSAVKVRGRATVTVCLVTAVCTHHITTDRISHGERSNGDRKCVRATQSNVRASVHAPPGGTQLLGHAGCEAAGPDSVPSEHVPVDSHHPQPDEACARHDPHVVYTLQRGQKLE
jgi:hypothetical protein